MRLAFEACLNDIHRMQKPAKIARKPRPDAPASLGRTKEGVLIARPDFKPKSFTLRQLDEAIRAVKQRQAASQAG